MLQSSYSSLPPTTTGKRQPFAGIKYVCVCVQLSSLATDILCTKLCTFPFPFCIHNLNSAFWHSAACHQRLPHSTHSPLPSPYLPLFLFLFYASSTYGNQCSALDLNSVKPTAHSPLPSCLPCPTHPPLDNPSPLSFAVSLPPPSPPPLLVAGRQPYKRHLQLPGSFACFWFRQLDLCGDLRATPKPQHPTPHHSPLLPCLAPVACCSHSFGKQQQQQQHPWPAQNSFVSFR